MNVGLKETECGEEMKSNSEAKWTVLWQIPLFGAAVIAWVAFVIYAIHDGGTTRDGAARKDWAAAGREMLREQWRECAKRVAC